MKSQFSILVLAFLSQLFWSQAALTQANRMPPCTVSEDSIFKEVRICGKSRQGSLTKADLTVAGFAIGKSTLEDVARQFVGSSRFKLAKEGEASTGICLKTKGGDAVVFASSDLVDPRGIDSVFIAAAKTFETQGANCLEVANLQDGPSTKSGIRLGIEKERLLAILHIPPIKEATFAVDYETSPDKALWVAEESKVGGKGWVAMSGAYGGFRNGRLRWIVFYGGVSG